MQLSFTRRSQPLPCSVGLHQHAGVVPDFHALSECFCWGVEIGVIPVQLLQPPPRRLDRQITTRVELLDSGQ